jgi:hypothetical protein
MVKKLKVEYTTFTHQLPPAAVFRKIQVEGFYPIIEFVNHVVPFPDIYTADPNHNAVMNSVGCILLAECLNLNLVRELYTKQKTPSFALASRTPLFIDICAIAATAYNDYKTVPWLNELVDRFQNAVGPEYDVRATLWGGEAA